MKRTLFTAFDRLMAAVTFAEEGEFSAAREFLRKDECGEKQQAAMPEIGMHQPVQTSRS